MALARFYKYLPDETMILAMAIEMHRADPCANKEWGKLGPAWTGSYMSMARAAFEVSVNLLSAAGYMDDKT